MKIVQIVGHEAGEAAAYVGAEREITLDIDNQDLLIHDGVTPGGFRVLNLDNADTRYQLKSAEVSGIGPFAEDDRGFLVRRGAEDYVLRIFGVTAELTLLNVDGYNGNPTLALADSFTNRKTFQSGLIGNLVGNTQGNGVGAFTGAFNGTFNGTLSGDSNGVHHGDVIGNVAGNLTGNVTGNVTGDITGDISGTAGHAIQLTNARDLAFTSGDVLGGLVGFDGSANVNGMLTIQGHVVTNTKLAQMATHTIKGNASGGTADAADLTGTQVTALLDQFTGDSGSGALKGLLMAAAAGDAAAGKVALAGGTWGLVNLLLQTLHITAAGNGFWIQMGDWILQVGMAGPFNEGTTYDINYPRAFPTAAQGVVLSICIPTPSGNDSVIGTRSGDLSDPSKFHYHAYDNVNHAVSYVDFIAWGK